MGFLNKLGGALKAPFSATKQGLQKTPGINKLPGLQPSRGIGPSAKASGGMGSLMRAGAGLAGAFGGGGMKPQMPQALGPKRVGTGGGFGPPPMTPPPQMDQNQAPPPDMQPFGQPQPFLPMDQPPPPEMSTPEPFTGGLQNAMQQIQTPQPMMGPQPQMGGPKRSMFANRNQGMRGRQQMM